MDCPEVPMLRLLAHGPAHLLHDRRAGKTRLYQFDARAHCSLADSNAVTVGIAVFHGWLRSNRNALKVSQESVAVKLVTGIAVAHHQVRAGLCQAINNGSHSHLKRKPSLPSLRRKLDAVFSRFIRLRDTTHGLGECVTCGAVHHWKAANAGHFIVRQHLATRYDPRNAHFQCVVCNLYRHGNLVEYNAFMLRKYGQEVIDELRALKRTTANFKRADYESMIERFST